MATLNTLITKVKGTAETKQLSQTNLPLPTRRDTLAKIWFSVSVFKTKQPIKIFKLKNASQSLVKISPGIPGADSLVVLQHYPNQSGVAMWRDWTQPIA